MSKKYLFIKTPFFEGQLSTLASKLIFTFFLLNVFLGASSFVKAEAIQDEKDEVSIFLENLMIRDGGLYTLLGSKPMTEFDITDTIDETEEDIVQSYKELKTYLDAQKLKTELPRFISLYSETYQEALEKMPCDSLEEKHMCNLPGECSAGLPI